MPAGLLLAIALLAETEADPPVDPPRAPVANLQGCRPGSSDEVVVCAPRPGPSPYRLPKVANTYKRKPIRAESVIARGVVAAVNLESVELPGGAKSDRAMVRFKFKF